VESNGKNTSWRSVKDPRAIRSSNEVRGLRKVPFQSPIILGEIVTIGSNSTRVVGSRANLHFRNSRIGETSDFGFKSREHPIREISKISRLLDQRKHAAIDLPEGMIS
jgi:hypothetical protein